MPLWRAVVIWISLVIFGVIMPLVLIVLAAVGWWLLALGLAAADVYVLQWAFGFPVNPFID